MNKEEQIGTLVGLDLILSPEHYKEITKLQEENKHLNLQLDQALKDYDEELTKRYKVIEILKDTNIEMPSTLLIETIDYALKILEANENK